MCSGGLPRGGESGGHCPPSIGMPYLTREVSRRPLSRIELPLRRMTPLPQDPPLELGADREQHVLPTGSADELHAHG